MKRASSKYTKTECYYLTIIQISRSQNIKNILNFTVLFRTLAERNRIMRAVSPLRYTDN